MAYATKVGRSVMVYQPQAETGNAYRGANTNYHTYLTSKLDVNLFFTTIKLSNGTASYLIRHLLINYIYEVQRSILRRWSNP